jgi:kettin
LIVFSKKQRTLKSSPPVFEKLPPVGQFVEGGDAYFECRVQGEPTPNVVWTRKGMIIKNGNR